MMPIVNGLEQQYQGQLTVQRVNAETGNGPEIIRAYRIPGHPTTLIVDHRGHVVKQLIGPQPLESVEEELQGVLTSSADGEELQ